MKKVLACKDKPPIECTALEEDASGISGKKKCLRLHPVLFAAFTLIFTLVLGLTFHALGYNVWRLFASWDDETMEMRIDVQGKITGLGYENDIAPAFTDTFFQKLKELEMYPLLPSWMPDGFVLNDVESKIETEYLRYALGEYTSGERLFHISVYKNTAGGSGGIWSLQKDEREPEIYEQGGIKFYIMDNLSRSRAFWFDPPYNINISGNVTRDELKQMINSMFERK